MERPASFDTEMKCRWQPRDTQVVGPWSRWAAATYPKGRASLCLRFPACHLSHLVVVNGELFLEPTACEGGVFRRTEVATSCSRGRQEGDPVCLCSLPSQAQTAVRGTPVTRAAGAPFLFYYGVTPAGPRPLPISEQNWFFHHFRLQLHGVTITFT